MKLVPNTETELLNFLESVSSTLYAFLDHCILQNENLLEYCDFEVRELADEASSLPYIILKYKRESSKFINLKEIKQDQVVKITSKESLVNFIYEVEEIIFGDIIFNDETMISDLFLGECGQVLTEFAIQASQTATFVAKYQDEK